MSRAVPDWMLLLLGLVAIVAGAELLVRNASRLARRLGVPPLVIGLTIVSLGTSAPELAIGVDAALRGSGELAVGNVAGTNTLTLLLILGLAALIRPLEVRSQSVRLDLPALVVAAATVTVLALDGRLGRADGVILVALGVAYSIVLVVAVRRERRGVQREFQREYGTLPSEARRRGAALLEAGGVVGGIAVVVLASDWLVDGAIGIATAFAIPEEVIGLTIVAIGTSAPELATTIVATLRGQRDVAVGNLLGSATYNIVLILGVTLIVADPAVPIGVGALIDLVVMTGAAAICLPIMLTGERVRRVEGALLVAAYLGYLGWLLATRT